ncbi:MAG: YciI family protein [Pyrinomonadaceae bacterium]
MKTFIAAAFLSLMWTASASVQAQEFKLVQFHMGILKKVPNLTPATDSDTAALHEKHVAYVLSLLDSGKAVIAGPFNDNGDIAGIYIFRAKSAEEAKEWASADPVVAAGRLDVEMHPWFAEDVMKKPAAPIKLTTAYFAFLKRGPKWTREVTPETKALLDGHMANIKRLAETKKLVVAGPFGDDSGLAGIFVFRVDSLEEAKALAASDPAVQAGRFLIEVHPWQVPDGVLP